MAMAMEVSAGGLACFSDQTHLEFYQRRTSSLPSPSLRPAPPLRSASSVARLRVAAQSVGCPPTIAAAPEQACWMKEFAELKLQMKQRKKEAKSQKKQEKKRMKMQMKQKGLVGKKKRCSEASSSSESSDEECAPMSMAMLREERPFFGASVTVPESSELEGIVISRSADNGNLPAAESITGTNHTTFESHIPVSVNGSICNKEAGSLCAETSIHRERAGFPTKSNTSNNLFTQAPNRVEVCTGGKCRKAGSGQLLSALSTQIPSSSDVVAVPCKCMGHCKMAMNVKVFKEDTNPQHHSHVRVEDANFILNHHYGLGRPPSGLPVLEPHDWTRVPASTNV